MSGCPGPAAPRGVGVALWQEGRTAGPVAYRRTDPGGRDCGRTAGGEERGEGERGTGGGGRGERDGGEEAAGVEERGLKQQHAHQGQHEGDGTRGIDATAYHDLPLPPTRVSVLCPWVAQVPVPLYPIGLQGLQQPFRLEQRPADRIRRVGIESRARHEDNVGDGHHGSAGGTFAVRPEFGAAVRVPEDSQLGLLEVLTAPLREGPQRRPQRDAALGDDVLVARRRLLVAALFEDPLLGERLEPGREDGARDAEVDEEVVVAPDAVERVADDEERPPLADDLQRAGDRAFLRPAY